MLTRNELVRYKATLSEWHPPDEFIRPVGELEHRGLARKDGFLLLTIRPSGKCKVAQPPTARCSLRATSQRRRAPTEADAPEVWGMSTRYCGSPSG